MPLPRPTPADENRPSPPTAEAATPVAASSPPGSWRDSPALLGLDIPLPPVPTLTDLAAVSEEPEAASAPHDRIAPSPEEVAAVTAQLSVGDATTALSSVSTINRGSRRVSMNPFKERERRQKRLMLKLLATAAGVMLAAYIVIHLNLSLPRTHAPVRPAHTTRPRPAAAAATPRPPVLLNAVLETHAEAQQALALAGQLKGRGLDHDALDAYRTAAAELDAIDDQSALRAEAHSGAAALLSQEEDLAGAADEYRIALRLRPDDPVINNNYAVLRFATAAANDDRAQALAMLQKAVKKEPTNPDIHDNLLYVLRQTGKNGEANAENDRFNQVSTVTARQALLDGSKSSSSQDIVNQPLLKL